MKTIVRRSILFVPSDRIDRIEKSINLPADSITIDLEDAVAQEKKEEGRQILKKALEEFDFCSKEIIVRVNSIGTLNGLKDILMLKECSRLPDAIMLPKTESADEVVLFTKLIGEIDAEIELLIILESCKGILCAKDIVEASSKVSGVIFGGGDLSGEIGCSMTWDNMYTARQIVLMAAASAGIDAIDVPYLDMSDLEGLAKESKKVASIGFSGKIAIHPTQIDVINEMFTPEQDEFIWARKIIKATNKLGTGAICVDGKMVDKAIVKRARKVAAIAEKLEI
jgi:(S)-citramalyl-CoA lyase